MRAAVPAAAHSKAGACVRLCFLASLSQTSAWADRYDDFHYPSEEPAERAAAERAVPAVLSGDAPGSYASFRCPGPGTTAVNASCGGTVQCGAQNWSVRAVWSRGTASTSPSESMAVTVALEHEFRRWGCWPS